MSKFIYFGQQSHIAFSFITTSNSAIAPEITTHDLSLASWYCSDGQEFFNNNAPIFNFIDSTEKTITVFVDHKMVKGIQGFNNASITFINLLRLTKLSGLIQLQDNTELISFIAPVNMRLINYIDISNTKIESIDLSHCVVDQSDLRLITSSYPTEFIQPLVLWTNANLLLGINAIPGTLDLSNAYFKGILKINYSMYLEKVQFNPSITYRYITLIDFDNSPSLKFVDLGLMNGILTPQGSKITLRNIGATSDQVDRMMYRLNEVTISQTESRTLDLRDNSIPSELGLSYKSLLENKGINVLVDTEIDLLDKGLMNFDATRKEYITFGRQNWIDFTQADQIEVTFASNSVSGTQTIFAQGNRSYWRQRWAINMVDGKIEVRFYNGVSIIPHDCSAKTTVKLIFSVINGIGGTVIILVNDVLADTLLGISMGLSASDLLVPTLGARHFDYTDHPNINSPIQNYDQWFTGKIWHARFNDVFIGLNTLFGDVILASNALDGKVVTDHPDGLAYINSVMWEEA